MTDPSHITWGLYGVTEKVELSTTGSAGNLGMRFAVGRKQKNIEARLSYMGSVNKYTISSVGIAALFNF